MPVGAPNNALIFINGNVKMKDMMIAGAPINIIGILVVFLASNTWLGLIFDISSPKSQHTSLNSSLINMTLYSTGNFTQSTTLV
jgi:hypothetical protein